MGGENMKQSMKYFKLYSCVIVALLLFFFVPAKTEAADYQQIRFHSGDNGARTKIGNYYFWGSYDDYGAAYLNISKSSNAAKGTYIVTMNQRSPVFSIVTDGSQIFYTSANKNFTKQTIYSVNINGKNKKKYAVISGAEVNLKKYYNNQLYFSSIEGTSSSNSTFYSISLKNKKIKTIAKNCGVTVSDGKYLYLSTESKTNITIKIFDCQKSKVIKTCKIKKSSSESTYLSTTKKYLYIIVRNQGNNGMKKIYKYAADGTGSPELLAELKCAYIYLKDDNYFYYELKNDKTGEYTYYRYNIKKKKSHKISLEVYEENI